MSAAEFKAGDRIEVRTTRSLAGGVRHDWWQPAVVLRVEGRMFSVRFDGMGKIVVVYFFGPRIPEWRFEKNQLAAAGHS